MLPPPCPGTERVTSLRILGVIVNEGWRPPTTWPCYCRRAPVCCTRWESCARTAFQRHRCTTYFAPLSFPGSSMRRQHGRECAHQLIVAVLTRSCVAANASATEQRPAVYRWAVYLCWRWFLQPHQDQLQSRTTAISAWKTQFTLPIPNPLTQQNSYQ